MARLIDVRLTVIGEEPTLRRLEDSKWQRILRARHVELYEFSAVRRVWWFQTDRLSMVGVKRLSAEWPRLTLLLDYENHVARAKGLLKASVGKIDRCEFNY